MTKEQMLNEFQEITNHWCSPIIQIPFFKSLLTKKECEALLNAARCRTMFIEFRLFKSHGYALDHCYNRYYLYDRRKK